MRGTLTSNRRLDGLAIHGNNIATVGNESLPLSIGAVCLINGTDTRLALGASMCDVGNTGRRACTRNGMLRVAIGGSNGRVLMGRPNSPDGLGPLHVARRNGPSASNIAPRFIGRSNVANGICRNLN